MTTISITLSEEQLAKVVEAYRTIQEFLATVLSPNEIYQREFLRGLQESEEELKSGRTTSVTSFDDFMK